MPDAALYLDKGKVRPETSSSIQLHLSRAEGMIMDLVRRFTVSTPDCPHMKT